MTDPNRKKPSCGWIERDGTVLSDEEMETKLLAAVTTEPGDQKAAIKLLADFYRFLNRWDDYAHWLLRLLSLAEDDAETCRLLIQLALTSEGLEDWEAATRYYLRLIVMRPSSSDISYYSHNNLGYCLNQQGKWFAAESYCRHAIRIDPERHNAHKNLGLALRGQARFVEAGWAFVHAAELNPEDPRALAHLQEIIRDEPSALFEAPGILTRVRELELALSQGMDDLPG